ncbi:hypothetical protein [Bacillus horti]|uniref:Uncharacterized protein n=1 Tax=Caldalkalibacillus horti TaxID=77523 RepID=A0ABT9W0A8_9BACI|nr:hypothetical protein [Bacillus horti]MDQ0166689.1 hypothetical protein [Bacillus horti]
MKLSEFFSGINQKKKVKEAINKIDKLEQHIYDLEQKLLMLDQPNHHEENTSVHSQAEQISPPIIVEKLHIEKISIDKFELSNNFGALGIKELQGKLNIGANYGEANTTAKHIKTNTTSAESNNTEEGNESPNSLIKNDHTSDSLNRSTSNFPPRYSIKGKEE